MVWFMQYIGRNIIKFKFDFWLLKPVFFLEVYVVWRTSKKQAHYRSIGFLRTWFLDRFLKFSSETFLKKIPYPILTAWTVESEPLFPGKLTKPTLFYSRKHRAIL